MMKSRAWRYGSGMTAYTLVVVGLFALVNYLSAMHYTRFDLTAAGKYSLSPRTEKLLGRLPYGVRAIAFVKDDDAARMRYRRVLEQYSYRGNRFQWEFADPDKQPGLAHNYNITQYDTVILVGHGEKKETIVGEFNEEKLTNAILRLISTKERAIYFTKGHGEKDIHSREPRGYDNLRVALREQNYTVDDIALFASPVPEDASVLVVAGPEKDLTDGERDKIGKFLSIGGKALFMVDPFTLKETVAWLEQYGLAPENDVIVDKTSRMLGGDDLAPAVADYEEHPITRGFRLTTFYPLARSINIKDNPSEGIRAFALAKTNPGTWGETDEAGLKKGTGEFRKKEDMPGPLTIAAGAEITSHANVGDAKPTKGALLVIGDSDFVANSYLNIGGNRDFILNSLNWLAEENDRISIGSRNSEMDPVIFSAAQISAIAAFIVLALPAAVLIAAMWINLRRKRA